MILMGFKPLQIRSGNRRLSAANGRFHSAKQGCQSRSPLPIISGTPARRVPRDNQLVGVRKKRGNSLAKLCSEKSC
jgi:hypothetical protein